jgi:hypothetical protein
VCQGEWVEMEWENGHFDILGPPGHFLGGIWKLVLQRKMDLASSFSGIFAMFLLSIIHPPRQLLFISKLRVQTDV